MDNERLKMGEKNLREGGERAGASPRLLLVGGDNTSMREAVLALRLARVPFKIEAFTDYEAGYPEHRGEPFLQVQETSGRVVIGVEEIYGFAQTRAESVHISLPSLTDIRETIK